MIINRLIRLSWRPWCPSSVEISSSAKYHIHRQYYSAFSAYSKTHEAKAVSEAERLVGYPTSFLSLRHLLTDEVSNVASYMKKLLSSRHPLIHTIR